MITSSGHIKLTDFGTALIKESSPLYEASLSIKDSNSSKSPREKSKTQIDSEEDDEEVISDDEDDVRCSFVGTAEYVSPEVLQNEPVDESCDLWALGCIIYCLFCGKTPFHCDTEYLTFQEIIGYCEGKTSLNFPSSFDDEPQLKSLITSLLLKNPSDRLGFNDYNKILNDNELNSPERDPSLPALHTYFLTSLKSHPYFSSIDDWNNILSIPSLYTPDPSTFPSPDNMYDGSQDDWVEDGDATHISIFNFNQKIENEKNNEFNKNDSKWKQFLQPNEKQVFTSLIWKRRGLFWKSRQLILTDQPRLIYVDPVGMKLKGEIPWSNENPVSCIPV